MEKRSEVHNLPKTTEFLNSRAGYPQTYNFKLPQALLGACAFQKFGVSGG